MNKNRILFVGVIAGLLLIIALLLFTDIFYSATRKGRGKIVSDGSFLQFNGGSTDSVEVSGDICVFEEDGSSVPPGTLTYKFNKRKFSKDFVFEKGCEFPQAGDTVCYKIKNNGTVKITFPKNGKCN